MVTREELEVDLKCKFLVDIPYNFYGQLIYPIKVRDVFEMGENKFQAIMQPYVVTAEYLDLVDVAKQIPLFNLLVLIPNIKQAIQDSLILIFKLNPSEIRFVEGADGINSYFLIRDKLIINHLKFAELRQHMLIMCCAKELKKPVKSKIEKVAEKYKKGFEILMAKRKQNPYLQAEQRSVELLNVFNTIVHSQMIIDYEKVSNFNVFQLYNSYQALNIKEGYDYTMKIATSGMCTNVEKLDLTPFSQRLAKADFTKQQEMNGNMTQEK